MKIIVTSTAQQKIKAVRLSFEAAFPDKKIEVEGFKAPSLINEQPVGEKEMYEGADNRLKEALKSTQGDVFISMENGIKQIRDDQWVDLACVILYFPRYRQEFRAYSASVPFPTECVKEAMRKGFKNHTVGSVMAQMRDDIDKQDPHLSLTGKSRVIYLSETIDQLIVEAKKQHLFFRMS